MEQRRLITSEELAQINRSMLPTGKMITIAVGLIILGILIPPLSPVIILIACLLYFLLARKNSLIKQDLKKGFVNELEDVVDNLDETITVRQLRKTRTKGIGRKGIAPRSKSKITLGGNTFTLPVQYRDQFEAGDKILLSYLPISKKVIKVQRL